MVTYKDKTILINQKPVLILAGEIHYYRLDPDEWQDRIDRLKECGMNAVATYVPWICHEYIEGDIDLTGRTNPRLNIKGFIELCEKNDLYIFLRPGPFIMAEMKNDGIPYFVYQNYPETIPCGFDGVKPTTPTLDYLSKDFLDATKKWYKEIMTLASFHLYQNGGKIIAIQLDNEIGMLSWVSNKPDLTPNVLDYFIDWLYNEYNQIKLEERYPFEISKNEETYSKFISPMPPYDVLFHRDLGFFMRARFKKYVSILKDYAKEYGIHDILFVVNIHGTGAGRGFTYPIGVSQLLKTYDENDNIISGSDVYFDDFKVKNFQDMYLCNEITACVNQFGKPLTSVEFNCGDCNFGDDLGGRSQASANDARIRLFVAQGNKLINFYLFTGGTNYRFPHKSEDGNDRCATTGENHGFAAPIGPDGTPNYTYPRMARVTNMIMNLSEKFADSFIEYDDLAYGFIPDYFMTEYCYEKSKKTTEIYSNLSNFRSYNAWEATTRAMLLNGLKPYAMDIQNNEISGVHHLFVPSASYMASELQRKLLEFIKNGGSLLLHGRIPRFDMEGNPCTILAEAFQVDNFVSNPEYQFGYNASIQGGGFLSDMKEYHCNDFECFDVENAETILSVYDTGKTCGFYKEIGQGRIAVISVHYKCYPKYYDKIFNALMIKRTLTHDIDVSGIGVFMTTTRNKNGDRFLHLINMDDVDKEFNVFDNGIKCIPSRKVFLGSLDALALPIGVDFHCAYVNYSTAEVIEYDNHKLVFRISEKFSQISLKTDKKIVYSKYQEITNNNDEYLIKTDNRLFNDVFVIEFE